MDLSDFDGFMIGASWPKECDYEVVENEVGVQILPRKYDSIMDVFKAFAFSVGMSVIGICIYLVISRRFPKTWLLFIPTVFCIAVSLPSLFGACMQYFKKVATKQSQPLVSYYKKDEVLKIHHIDRKFDINKIEALQHITGNFGSRIRSSQINLIVNGNLGLERYPILMDHIGQSDRLVSKLADKLKVRLYVVTENSITKKVKKEILKPNKLSSGVRG